MAVRIGVDRQTINRLLKSLEQDELLGEPPLVQT